MKQLNTLCMTLCVIAVIALSAQSDSTKVETPKTDSAKVQAAPCGVSCFEWLPGTWKMEHGGMTIQEIWKKDSSGFAGVGLTLKGADTAGVEKMWMKATDSGFFFIAEVSQNPAPVLFKLISSDSSRFVFENQTHDFPQRVIYHFKAPDTLHARIEGVIQEEARGIDFPYVRVK